MAPSAIVSYDDTLNDHDALTLARVLADAGAELMLAYVRHSMLCERAREELEEHEAQALLERGARWLGDLDVARRVVMSASTAGGLKWLAEQEQASIVIFGSDYRTPAGHVAPQHSAQTLLEGGPAAVAIAPASYGVAGRPAVRRIGILAGAGDDAALLTACELADHFDAALTSHQRAVDLLVVGSRPEAPEGRVMLSTQAQNAVEESIAPVLVLPRAVPLRFQESVLA